MSRQNKYNARELDHITVMVRKGWLDILKSYAEAEGKSLNKFILNCITEVYGIDPTKKLNETRNDYAGLEKNN